MENLPDLQTERGWKTQQVTKTSTHTGNRTVMSDIGKPSKRRNPWSNCPKPYKKSHAEKGGRVRIL